MWSVYLIYTGNRTYVGCTTDPARRLRQHNREIRGGARATQRGAGSWQFVMYVEGFPNRSSACRWEALVKKRARGIRARSEALFQIALGECPGVDKGKRKYIPPKKLKVVAYGS